MKMNRRAAITALAAAVTPLCAQRSIAQEGAAGYPAKPLHLIVPYPAGGSTDVTARIFAEALQRVTGQPVIVENRGGASGTIGTTAVMQSAPDGYTLLFSTSTNQVIAPLLMAKPPYDGIRDMAAVTPLVRFVGLLLVNASLPVKSITDLVAYAKAHPGKLNYASAGIGSTNHLLGEMFKSRTGIDMLHVPYKGAAGSIVALAADEVQVSFDTLPAARAFLKQGRVRALATVGDHRSALAPEIPTLVELKIFDGAADYWMGIFAPLKTPAAVQTRLRSAIDKAATDAAFRDHAAVGGGEIKLASPDDFNAQLRAESARWSDVIRKNNIRAE